MKLGTLAASTTTVINLDFVPACIHFVAATAPSSVIVNVLGDGVICNLDANGVAATSREQHVGRVTNGFFIALADGMVKKTCTITITNTVAGTVDVFGYSDRIASAYVVSMAQKVFANSGVQLSNFKEALLPGMAATDELTITYQNAFNQKMTLEDLRADNSLVEFVGNDASDLRVKNENGLIKSISYIPAADRTIYITKYSYIGNQP